MTSNIETIILTSYFISLCILFVFGLHGFIMVYHHLKNKEKEDLTFLNLENENNIPTVTIQLPLYNELYVASRIIDSTCKIEYPKDKLEIQVLDDSTDETINIVEEQVLHYQKLGFDIKHIRRNSRDGFKAGALKYGLEFAKGEFVAIFDSDFIPKKEFLLATIPYFQDEKIGMVQTRWEHLNDEISLLTKAQAMALDGHFVMEQNVRNKSGYFINFNGTGGVWRKSCIIDAGNWEADTITEDLDLSYRAQMKGWKFRFLKNFTSPSELPAEINALKAQQFRWTKGAVEVAHKLLFKVWKSNTVSLDQKIHSTFHLTNNIVFPFILLTGILNVPIVFIKHQGAFDNYFAVMSFFTLSFVGSFMFYFYGQKEIYKDWRKRILLFPLFMAGSMGFAVSNTKAVIEGFFKKKSEFVRTPKYNLTNETALERKKKLSQSKYAQKISLLVIIEFILAIYFTIGIAISIYYVELSALPFQILFFSGFGFSSFLSIKHFFETKKIK